MQIIRSQRKPVHIDVVPTLPLYRSAPPLEVRLEDFELYAMDRLRGIIFLSYSVSPIHIFTLKAVNFVSARMFFGTEISTKF